MKPRLLAVSTDGPQNCLVLELCAGDTEEHALLLSNCFKAMGKAAFVVLGDGVPEGRTAYVLTKDLLKKETTLWNASTGTSYSTELLPCPITSVGLGFDDTNTLQFGDGVAVKSIGQIKGRSAQEPSDLCGPVGKKRRPVLTQPTGQSATGSKRLIQKLQQVHAFATTGPAF